MGVFDALKRAADKMLKQEGQQVVVHFVDQDGTYSADAGAVVRDPTVTVTTYATLLDYALENVSSTVYKDSLILKDDKEAYVSWQSTFPRHPAATGDFLVDKDGTTWRIITVKRNSPSGVVEIMYNCQLRR